MHSEFTEFGGRSVRLDGPTHTEVKPVTKALEAASAAAVASREADRQISAARRAREQWTNDTRRDMAEGVASGKPIANGVFLERKRDLDDALELAELNGDTAREFAHKARTEAIAVMLKHTPALRAEAARDLDVDRLKLATVHGQLRAVHAGLTSSVGTLGLLTRLAMGDSPTLTPSKTAAAATIALDKALEHLTDAAALSKRVLEFAQKPPVEPNDDEGDGDE